MIALIGVAAPLGAGKALAATPACQTTDSDSDGDGWGWENNQSCRVTGTSTGSDNATGNNNACSSSDSDPDGDGWGWENNQSCRVTQTTDGSDSQSDAAGTPDCVAANSDPDNDGWGWENGRSCRVTDDSEDAAAPEETPTAPENTEVAECSDSVVDDNNDGWGWENNQSCRIQTTTTPTVTLKVMPVGDSITHGHRSVSSYHKPLEALFDDNNCNFQYVGSQLKNFAYDGYRAPHEGYSGHTADHFLTGNNNTAGDNRGINDSMVRYNPDVVLLHIGSNDMNRGDSVDGTVSEIDKIVDIIHQQNSRTIVLLANVIPWYGTPQQRVTSLGSKIQAYINQLADNRVKLVDVRSGYTRSMMVPDGVHPNATGEAHIADAFFDAYEKAGLCR
ncbi:MAG: carbohydrate-binding domain-containing protein [Pseudomonadota bacterium]